MLSILSAKASCPRLSSVLRALHLTTAINCSLLLLAGGCAMINPAPENDAAASAGNGDNLEQRKSASHNHAASLHPPGSNEQVSPNVTERKTTDQTAAIAASADLQQPTIVQEPQQEPQQPADGW